MVVLGTAAAGAAVLAGAAFGIWTSLTGDDREPTGTGQTLISAPPQGSAGRAEPAADGSQNRPWPQGTVQRLKDDGSCWLVSVDRVQGRQATLTASCDQAGTRVYGNPTPREWLNVYAVGQDGSTLESTLDNATPQDTFWTQGNLMDATPVTVTVTLPDVGPLAAVVVRQDTGGYGWHWDATG